MAEAQAAQQMHTAQAAALAHAATAVRDLQLKRDAAAADAERQATDAMRLQQQLQDLQLQDLQPHAVLVELQTLPPPQGMHVIARHLLARVPYWQAAMAARPRSCCSRFDQWSSGSNERSALSGVQTVCAHASQASLPSRLAAT